MTDLAYPAINVDAVMADYVRCMPAQDGRPPSVDALALFGTDAPVLIEFKSGRNISRDAIRSKLLSSLLMLTELSGMTVAELRNHMRFLLVYDRKAKYGAGNESLNPKTRIQPSDGRGEIIDAIRRYARQSTVPKSLRGMDNGMKGVYVKDFGVLDKGELEGYLKQLVS